jgi:hypothetical protein
VQRLAIFGYIAIIYILESKAIFYADSIAFFFCFVIACGLGAILSEKLV